MEFLKGKNDISKGSSQINISLYNVNESDYDPDMDIDDPGYEYGLNTNAPNQDVVNISSSQFDCNNNHFGQITTKSGCDGDSDGHVAIDIDDRCSSDSICNSNDLVVVKVVGGDKDDSENVGDGSVHIRQPDVLKKNCTEKNKLNIIAKEDIPNQKVGKPCSCRNKCFENIGKETINKIFEEFWAISEYDTQIYYLQSLICEWEPERKRKKIGNMSSRVFHKFFVKVNQKNTIVCRTAFISIHGLSKKMIGSMLGKDGHCNIARKSVDGVHSGSNLDFYIVGGGDNDSSEYVSDGIEKNKQPEVLIKKITDKNVSNTLTKTAIPNHKVGKPCSCKNNCFENIGREAINEIFSKLWAISEYDTQLHYLQNLICECEPLRKRKKVEGMRSRTFRKFYVRINKQIKTVCRAAFISIHGLGKKMIESMLTKPKQVDDTIVGEVITYNASSSGRVTGKSVIYGQGSDSSSSDIQIVENYACCSQFSEEVDRGSSFGHATGTIQSDNDDNGNATANIGANATGGSIDQVDGDTMVNCQNVPDIRDNGAIITRKTRIPRTHVEKKGRTRVCLPDTWKANVAKTKRNHGLSYTSLHTKGDIPSRNVLNPCNCKDRVFEKVGRENIDEIFASFWAIGKYNEQNTYLQSLTCEVDPKRKRKKKVEGSRSRTAYRFHVKIHNKKFKVCKMAFISIHGLGAGRINWLFKKRSMPATDMPDRRGRKSNPHAISGTRLEMIHTFIKGLPVTASHYTRTYSPHRRYLEDVRSIPEVYKHYIKWLSETRNENIKVSPRFFRKVFCRDYNIVFKAPKKDVCSTCERLEMEIRNKRSAQLDYSHIQEKLNVHKNKAKIPYEVLRQANQAGTEDLKIIAIDMQQTFPCPRLRAGEAFYKRKLWEYNLCIYDINEQEATMNVWDEVTGGRGSIEVASCILKWLKIKKDQQGQRFTTLRIFSDNCGGQNKNIYIVLMALQQVHLKNLVRVEFVFYDCWSLLLTL